MLLVVAFFAFFAAQLMMATLRCSPMDRLAVVDFFEDMKKEGRLQVRDVLLHERLSVERAPAVTATSRSTDAGREQAFPKRPAQTRTHKRGCAQVQ